jgi:hypothetical protein
MCIPSRNFAGWAWRGGSCRRFLIGFGRGDCVRLTYTPAMKGEFCMKSWGSWPRMKCGCGLMKRDEFRGFHNAYLMLSPPSYPSSVLSRKCLWLRTDDGETSYAPRLAIDSSNTSIAMSASSFVTMSGGAMRIVLGPQPRNNTPRSKAASTMRSRSTAPYARVL